MWCPENRSEISCILASLILIENNIDISEERISALLDFSEIKFERHWPSTFVRLSQNFDLLEIMGCKKGLETNKLLQEITKDLDLNKDKSGTKEKQPKEASAEIESEGGDMGFGLFD